MNVRRNTKLLALFGVFLLTSFFYFNHTPRICVITEIDLKREFILTVSPLTNKELELARRSLLLVKEIDPTQHYEGFENIEVHWMNSSKFFVITVYKNDNNSIILLDQSLRIRNEKNPWEYLRLGVIYSHELSHALHGTKDPYTEQITDVKIWKLTQTDVELTRWISNWKP
jgi:hypothetical protein